MKRRALLMDSLNLFYSLIFGCSWDRTWGDGSVAKHIKNESVPEARFIDFRVGSRHISYGCCVTKLAELLKMWCERRVRVIDNFVFHSLRIKETRRRRRVTKERPNRPQLRRNTNQRLPNNVEEAQIEDERHNSTTKLTMVGQCSWYPPVLPRPLHSGRRCAHCRRRTRRRIYRIQVYSSATSILAQESSPINSSGRQGAISHELIPYFVLLTILKSARTKMRDKEWHQMAGC